MTKADEIRKRQLYIDEVMRRTLQPRKGFDGIKYARIPSTDQEYIRISDVRGTAVTMDITAESLEDIMTDIFTVMLFGVMDKEGKVKVPPTIITDDEKLLELAPLFR